MINPFHDTNWHPDLVARRSFAKSLIIGFPALAVAFTLAGWLKTHALPPWTPWLASLGAGLGLLLWLIPQIAKPFYLAWYFVACCIGIVVSNTLLAGFYYLAITPVGLLMSIAGRDPMKRRLDRRLASYWQDAERDLPAERYFRQY